MPKQPLIRRARVFGFLSPPGVQLRHIQRLGIFVGTGMKIRAMFWFAAIAATAHPLGNFSVNHYSRLTPSVRGIEIQYVIDLAEIPTFELLRDWGIDRSSPELENHAAAQAREWARSLSLRIDGRAVPLSVGKVAVTVSDGAGNLPILRIGARIHAAAAPGSVEYEDRNFEGRAGWKEIVISAGEGAQIESASHGDRDLSHALAEYPPDPALAPPQDLRATFRWSRTAVKTTQTVVKPIAQPASPPAPPTPPVVAQGAAGAVVKNDYLSRLLKGETLSGSAIALGLLIAFALGAAHALTPGHGKTVVAAYLVGSRGTMKHAAFLGAVVTLTHTIAVFALGLATLFLFRFVVPEKITQILGVISGLSIVAIGAWMLYRRIRAKNHHHHHHDHGHHHHHDHGHQHGPVHHHHDHEHPHSHSHVPQGDISWASLLTLAISGGLVPCESALILLLGAIALGRAGLGLILVLAFSLGLASVLIALGVVVLYAKHLLPDNVKAGAGSWGRWVPVGSAAVVLGVGLLLTAVSAGFVPASWAL